ncbi:MAG: exonuclease domain-containing protein [Coprococcus sp.]
MNYVVVDFEWNQSAYGKGSENRKMPFEIIEIGAVMLNEQLQEIDRFSETIRPKVYKKLHYVTKDLTGITQEELNASDPFPYVLVDFMLWCGDDFSFCTWGNMDLVELQRNMKYYGLEDLLEGPVRYYNVQKLFRLLYAHDEAAASLEAAVDYFRLPKDDHFHRAVNDAAYTAEIFRKMDMAEADKLYSVDYYQNPKEKKDEIHLTYESYYKYISREFRTKEEAMSDREVRSTRCYKCGRAARKKMHWFSARTKAYYCLASCPEHGYIRGKIRLKKTDEQRFYVVKTLRLIDEEGAEKLRQMKSDVLKKRREKRQKGCCGSTDEKKDRTKGR